VCRLFLHYEKDMRISVEMVTKFARQKAFLDPYLYVCVFLFWYVELILKVCLSISDSCILMTLKSLRLLEGSSVGI
jgi:hypothetical protein